MDWAAPQNNLGNALATFGERESGTTRLEEAVRKDLVPVLIGRRAAADTAQRFSPIWLEKQGEANIIKIIANIIRASIIFHIYV